MTSIKITGNDHTVELNGEGEPADLIKLAEETWQRTRPQERPRQQMGYASPLQERAPDRQVGGSPLWHYGDRPPEARSS